MKKHSHRVIVAMLLAVLVYGAFTLYSGYDRIASCLATYRWLTFVAGCALALGNYLIRFLKWEYYLKRLAVRGVPKFDSLLVFLSGFVLTVTPGKVGEVFKSLLLFETYQVPVARTAPIVVAERLTDLIGIICLILVGSLGFAGGLKWAGLGAVAVVLCLLVIMSRSFSDWSVRLAERLGERMPDRFGKLGPKVRDFWQSLRIMTSPAALLWPTAISIVAWAMEGLALWVILGGFDAQVPLAPALFFYATSQLAGALSPMPGGVGVTETILVGQLRNVSNVAPPIATASMILTRFATLWFAVAVGFTALALLRTRHPALRTKTEVSPEPTT